MQFNFETIMSLSSGIRTYALLMFNIMTRYVFSAICPSMGSMNVACHWVYNVEIVKDFSLDDIVCNCRLPFRKNETGLFLVGNGQEWLLPDINSRPVNQIKTVFK